MVYRIQRCDCTSFVVECLYGLVTVHGEMPVNYYNPAKTAETLTSLHDALFGPGSNISWTGRSLHANTVSGELIGGNISLIYSLIGTRPILIQKERYYLLKKWSILPS